MNEPAKGNWSALYQAAIAFQQAAPWECMDNEDLFAVENPDDGEVGYCSILGSGGEEFDLRTKKKQTELELVLNCGSECT